jgi:N-acetylglucosaminyldiphosphoundecaprenol N-acetyl-beta-D-mannosaminyltransferase
MTNAYSTQLKTIPLLKVRVHDVDMREALAIFDEFIQSRTPHHIITLDASMCVMAEKDSKLRKIIEKSDLITPDSVGVLWACKRMGKSLRERVSGVELVEMLCSLSHDKQYRLFFFGSAPGVAEQAAEKMRLKYPGCMIVGTHNGFFTEKDSNAIITQIQNAKPDILCVALGIPKQEMWISEHIQELGVPICIGVGGTLDVLSGNVRRAPMWMRKLSLEWLHRLISNPKKIGKVMTLPKFVMLILRKG